MDIERQIERFNEPEGLRVPTPKAPIPSPVPGSRVEELLPAKSWGFEQGGMPIGFHRGASSRRRGWVLMAWSLFASVVDLLLAFSLSCFLAVTYIAVVGLKASSVVNFFKFSFQPGLAMCFLLVFSSYLLFLRVFAGCTLGEWACGLRLGEPRHRMSNDYVVRVIQRFFVVAITGVVVLPVLSLIFGKDFAGRLSGLPLVQQKSR